MTMTEVAQRSSFVRELVGGVPVSPVGINFPDELDFDEWRAVGERVARLSGSTAWWLGDWMHFGFWEYGQKYEEAIAATGLAYQTLANYRSVCERFDFSRRKENLSFSHHQLVAGLSDAEQDTWLERAETEGLSFHQLHDALQDARAIDPPAKTTVTLEQIRFTVPPDRAERWKSAAEKAGQDFSEWAAGVLDEAAA
jgi:hypothetical protein